MTSKKGVGCVVCVCVYMCMSVHAHTQRSSISRLTRYTPHIHVSVLACLADICLPIAACSLACQLFVHRKVGQ